MRQLLWAVIIYGWTWCQLAEASFTIRGETDEAGPLTGWWSGRTEPLCWTGRRYRPRRSPAERHHRHHTQRTDCRAPPTVLLHQDAPRQGLGGAAFRGVPLPADLSPTQTAAAPHPRPPAPQRARMKRCVPTTRNITRIQTWGRRCWKTGWWNGRKRTRLCRSLWSHSTQEQVGHKICNMILSLLYLMQYKMFTGKGKDGVYIQESKNLDGSCLACKQLSYLTPNNEERLFISSLQNLSDRCGWVCPCHKFRCIIKSHDTFCTLTTEHNMLGWVLW